MRMHKAADLLAGKPLSIEELSRVFDDAGRLLPARFEDSPPIEPSLAPATGDMDLKVMTCGPFLSLTAAVGW
jgi:hypothetical protein